MTDAYTLEYRPATIRHGSGVVADLGAELDRLNRSRALVVTSSTVGSTPGVIEPVTAGPGERLVGVFDEVSAAKRVGTAARAAELVHEQRADALIALGGGSSLDTAKVVSVLAAHDDPRAAAERMAAAEAMEVPDGELTDIVAVPTTLPGADLTQVAGVTYGMDDDVPAEQQPSGGVGDPRLMPAVVFHDPALLTETPNGVLARSAMNGFDKGIEMLYAREHTPITDGVAVRGLRLLQGSLAELPDGASEDALSDALRGVACVQYGVSTPRAFRVSIIHSFGHALSGHYPIQQGVAHAIAAPHVLRYLFDRVDGRRALLAEAFDIDAEGSVAKAEAIVEAVAEVRDGLGLPSRLRDVEAAEPSDFPELATAVVEDSFMAAAPAGLDAEPDGIETVFEAMW
ncbi:MAG: iron-containing alcohol dehydrogenase family protein [Halolamina sp.]